MKLNKNVIASALLVPTVLVGLSACSSASKPKTNKIKGSFPVCQTTKVLDGVRVDRSAKTPCLVQDSNGYGVIAPSKSSTKSPSPSSSGLTVKPTSSAKATATAKVDAKPTATKSLNKPKPSSTKH
jgi:hypothetical protein